MDNYSATVISSEAYASKCDRDCDAAVLKADTLPKADNHPCQVGILRYQEFFLSL